MARALRHFGWLLFGLLVIPALAAQQTPPASPGVANPQQLVSDMVRNELVADQQDHTRWMYRSQEVKDGQPVEKEVIETEDGNLSILVAQGGRPISPELRRQEEARIQALIHDRDQLERRRQASHEDALKAERLLKLLPGAFLYQYVGTNDGAIELSFKPNPQFDPPTREARVFHHMAGTMVIDARQKRLKKIAGKLIDDVLFGYGILGRLHRGGTFEVDRAEVAPGLWKETLTDVHISGKAIFFKTISDQEHEVSSDFRQVSPDLSLVQAAQLLERASQSAMAENNTR